LFFYGSIVNILYIFVKYVYSIDIAKNYGINHVTSARIDIRRRMITKEEK